jgi:hypothetical protein
MLDPRSFSFSDVDALLAMPELHEVEARIAFELNLKIVPLNSTTKRMLLAEISQAGLPVSEIKHIIAGEDQRLVNFAVRHNTLSDLNHSGEFDPHEGDRCCDSNSKIIGLSEGCSVGYAILLQYAKLGRTELIAFLKNRRIPRAATTADEIIKLAVDI